MPGSGELWFTGSHTGGDVAVADDIRIAHVGSDGTGQTVETDHSPNPFPTGTTAGLYLNDLALDTAAGYYFALINDGSSGDDAVLVRGVIGSNAAPTTVVDFTDGLIVNCIQMDVVNHRIYVGWQDGSGSNAANTGIRAYSYDPSSGALTDLGFLTTWTTSGRATESGFNIVDPRDFALDSSTNSLFYTETLTGGVNTTGLFRTNLTTGAVTQVVSQTQFPDSGANGYFIDVEVDASTGLLYFSTQSQSPYPDSGYSTSESAIWYIAEGATNGTATQLTLSGLPGGGHFYPGDMAFDASTRQLYVESEESGDVNTNDDVIYVFQLNGDGTSASLIRTITPSPAFTGQASDIGALTFNAIPILAALSGNTTHAVEGGGAVALLSGAPAITDRDGGYLRSATVQITGNLDASGDHLGFGSGQQISGTVSGTSITLTWNSATGTLTLSGYDTVAHYQSVLQDIRYWTTSSSPTAVGATRTVTWSVNDGTGTIAAGLQNSQTSAITVDESAAGPTGGDDTLPGTGGDDSISGLGGDDEIDGGDGADYLDGGSGDDELTGGTGDDYLKGGTGADHMLGGAGADFYVVDDAGDNPDETGGDGVDTVQTRINWTLGADLENLVLGSAGGAINGTGNGLANSLTGNAYANTLSGLNGDDTLSGGGGDDSLYGGSGVDALDGGNQNDFLDGGDGDDSLAGGTGDDYLRGGDGADHMEGGAGNDFYAIDDAGDTVSETGGSGVDTVQSRLSWTLGSGFENLILGSAGGATDGTGNALRNTITGNAYANTLHGLGEVDTLYGDGGNDVLYGDDGNDLLYGENGYDRLYGGAGSDKMTGGAHADTFAFTDLDIHRSTVLAAADKDQILDLSFGGDHDVIDLSAIDADVGAGGDQGFTFVTAFTHTAGEATLTYNGSVSTLTLDVDGDGKADLRIEINGDVTGSMLNLYTGMGDANGGWVL